MLSQKCSSSPKYFQRVLGIASAALALSSLPAAVYAQPRINPVSADDAERLTALGERPAYSPDGKHIAFIGTAYGDAFEMDLETRKVRNLTGQIPHDGILRIQYLANGDFLVTAPRKHHGPGSRARLDLWVLSRDLQTVLQPLDEHPLEGVAVSRVTNRIAWTAFAPGHELKPDEDWTLMFVKPTRRYVADIIYKDGVPQISNKREIMSTLPKGCGFTEPQDFRDDDRELLFSCLGVDNGKPQISVMGHNMETGDYIVYRRVSGEYNEVEGVAPDGSWTTVECGKQVTAALPPLDMCALELKPGGKMTPLVVGAEPGTFADVSNSVVSPDGKQIAFQKSDPATTEYGEGAGVFVIDLDER